MNRFDFSMATRWLVGLLVAVHAAMAMAQVPHNQDRPPGPALSPQEAVKQMTVPEGFRVEIVACEPDLVNPVAMTIDERGRVWVTESVEYPRQSAGPGMDRIKILEDTNGDGAADKITIFAEGLNIPSGIAVGFGGVWVANAPDILFLQDTDGDDKADRQEVVVTGFARADTHELPNSLTFGPDGFLYGLNGVFNHGHVKYPKSNPNYAETHPGWPINCAVFRINPLTRKFELFAEGTSNPWGIAFDSEGSAFLSACVIDHLWHITETGYYHRQAGAYPPHTWKIESIVKHKHQKAAYCGIHYFDSDTYPEPFREVLYMGNIHGNCINADKLERNGSTYFATGKPDFLSANDAWFMPVAQKTGPDGCLYVLDWYDRYHCYQDARRDPQGIDRLKGRLYRIRYAETPRVVGFDLSKETDEQLLARLSKIPNDYFRSTIQRVFSERLSTKDRAGNKELRRALEDFVLEPKQPHKVRMHALFALVGSGSLDDSFHASLAYSDSSSIRAWGVRAAGNMGVLGKLTRTSFFREAQDTSAEVRIQFAIAAKKIAVANAQPALNNSVARTTVAMLWRVLHNSPDADPLLPQIVWRNLEPFFEDEPDLFLAQLGNFKFEGNASWAAILPRAFERILARQKLDSALVGRFFAQVRDTAPPIAKQCLSILAARIQSGEIKGDALKELKANMFQPLAPLVKDPMAHPAGHDAAMLAATWGDAAALKYAQQIFDTKNLQPDLRLQALSALIAANVEGLPKAVVQALGQRVQLGPTREKPSLTTAEFHAELLASLGRLQSDEVATEVLTAWKSFDAELQPRAGQLLTQRVSWAKQLLAAIGDKKMPAESLNANQVRGLKALKDKDLDALIAKHWGTIREERDPARQELIVRMQKFIRENPGNAIAGELVFAKVCGQCHKMYGKGEEVGPDITRNGRNSFDQLLSNVFDPSLVIGAAYQARTIITKKGRSLTGLPIEETNQRVVLKIQGGKLETIPRDEIDELIVSPLSMMPEQLEKQLKPEEMADLFAYLVLDRHPSDPQARQLPGVREVSYREVTDPKLFAEIVDPIAPGFQLKNTGEGGLALVPKHGDQYSVMRTHPSSKQKGAVLSGEFEIPTAKSTRLIVNVSYDVEHTGDWELQVTIDGQPKLKKLVSKATTTNDWAVHEVDLTAYAGKKVRIDLTNHPTDWSFEFAYWQRVAIVSE